jgi:hypothetical protein
MLGTMYTFSHWVISSSERRALYHAVSRGAVESVNSLQLLRHLSDQAVPDRLDTLAERAFRLIKYRFLSGNLRLDDDERV